MQWKSTAYKDFQIEILFNINQIKSLIYLSHFSIFFNVINIFLYTSSQTFLERRGSPEMWKMFIFRVSIVEGGPKY